MNSAGELEAAASVGSSGLDAALGYISALTLATKISTVIGLAALAILAAYLLSQQWVAARRATIDRAIASGDDAMLGTLLGNSNVPLGSLSNNQKYAIASDEVRQRFITRIMSQSLVFFAFLALLGFVVLIVAPKRADAQPIDPLTMAGLLKFVPEDQRKTQCEKTLEKALCARIVDMLRGVGAPPQPPAVKEAVKEALEKGTASPAFASAIRNSPIITLGRPEGWDIDFYWCAGRSEATNKARAVASAQALGQLPGERIAPGIVLGRIQTQPAPVGEGLPTAGSGRFISTDDTTGKRDATNAVLETLVERGQNGYQVRETPTGKRWHISVYDCAAPRFNPMTDLIRPANRIGSGDPR